uniref:Uncharacterized protein n=1 Tax=Timema monikensis TaxID=170555 RepID=A0A7R9EB50_9NEOP|nr:unnamed protein product [Timema monikensis]
MFCKYGRIDGELDRRVNASQRVVGRAPPTLQDNWRAANPCPEQAVRMLRRNVGEDGMAHERNLSLFVYSLRVEWLALDGALLVNNSVRVAWGGEGGTRAWCEGPSLLLEHGAGGVHTLRCVLHLLLFVVFVVFLFLLAEGVGLRVLRTSSASPVWAVDPPVGEWATSNGRRSSVGGFAPPDRLPRRWASAGPLLQRPAKRETIVILKCVHLWCSLKFDLPPKLIKLGYLIVCVPEATTETLVDVTPTRYSHDIWSYVEKSSV